MTRGLVQMANSMKESAIGALVFFYCLKLHKLTVFSTDTAKRQHTTSSREYISPNGHCIIEKGGGEGVTHPEGGGGRGGVRAS